MTTVIIPCSIKKEIKKEFGLTVNHQAQNAKTNCTVFYPIKIKNEVRKAEHKLLPKRISESFILAFNLVKTKNFFRTDYYNSYKEKIPTHILQQKFLI